MATDAVILEGEAAYIHCTLKRSCATANALKAHGTGIRQSIVHPAESTVAAAGAGRNLVLEIQHWFTGGGRRYVRAPPKSLHRASVLVNAGATG